MTDRESMEEALEKNAEFSKKVGEILNMALGIENNLEFFISNYFIKPQNSKTFFFNDLFMISSNFEKKIRIFREISKREEFNETETNKIIQSIKFVQKTRNKVAHWQAEKTIKNIIRFRKRTSRTRVEDVLELTDQLMKDLDKERLNAIHGITDFYLIYSKEGTIDEKPINLEDNEMKNKK